MSSQESENISADDIEVLEGLEPIRRRAQTYVGDLSRTESPSDLILTSLCHAIDEAMERNCKYITVTIRGTEVCTVYDVAMPLEVHPPTGQTVAETLLSVLRACHNMKKNFEVGSMYCKLGLAVLNALSSEFHAEIVANGRVGRQFHKKGIAQTPFIIEALSAPDKTELCFRLDNEIIQACSFDIEYLRQETADIIENLDVDLRFEQIAI
ncbi:MAG: hypothetical protein F6J87_11375 [Spirulina sp. SIO3F2]|nr:hypothetical protein [Spirulina sp. SIO3F2]